MSTATTNNPSGKGPCSEEKPRWVWTWLYSFVHWSSETMLRTAEKKLLSYLKTSYRGGYIDIGSCVGTNDKIWTISMNTESPKTPLVMLHGFGAGSALWLLNFDAFARNRPVYAMDTLGFGRSSRPKFKPDGLEAEKQFVQSIEEWRREMNIPEMILLGHSMGGFLATSYAIRHPDRVKHLILADPWGFPEKPTDINKTYKVGPVVRALVYVLQPLNPLWLLRAAGPWGQWVVGKLRPDIMRKFSTIVEDDKLIPEYIHQCNARTPTGESAFHSMMSSFGWAKHPMIARMPELRKDIPITILRGSRSWVQESSMEAIRLTRTQSYVNMQVISGAGHHVYADKPEIFNQCVLDACAYYDNMQQQQDEGTESENDQKSNN